MKNLEMENSITAEDTSLKARFLALDLAGVVSNRAVKQLIIELYGDAVCFTYLSSKGIFQIVLSTKSSPEALVESLRVSPVQQVATELAHEIKEYSFGLQKSYCEPQDLQLSMDRFTENLPPFTRLNCMHEGADDRMMFHVQDILSHRLGLTSLTLSSGDTDVFVFLLYHFTANWRNLGLQELWLIRNSGLKRSILPLHDVCAALGDELVWCLPALHALIGCDTTSKISTKSAALKSVSKPENSSLIKNFNNLQLTESAVQMAETFLVKCLKPATDLKTFDDLHLAAFNCNALKWTLRKLLALQPMQEGISTEPTTNYSCGSKLHLEMLAHFRMLSPMVLKEGVI